MAKPLQIVILVEEIAFGKVFRTLDTMPGVVSLRIVGEGTKDPSSPSGGRGQKKGGAQSSECVVLGALVRSGPLLRFDLTAALDAAGKKGASTIASTMQKLVKQKHVQKKGTGKQVSYNITSAGKKRFETACQIEESN